MKWGWVSREKWRMWEKLGGVRLLREHGNGLALGSKSQGAVERMAGACRRGRGLNLTS